MKSFAVRSGPLRAALLGLLASILLGTGIPEIHNHNANTAGFYSEQCPLARLAVPGWGLTAVAPDPLTQPDAIPALDLPPASAEPSALRPAFAPRAPPSVA
jgi:hypothetical protein